MDLITRMCEDKINKAKEEGVFDNLENKGKPLELEDLSNVPENLRPGYLLLKNSGYLPEELELKKEIVNLEKLIESCHDEEDKEEYQQKLNEKSLRFNSILEKRGIKKSVIKSYKNKIKKNIGLSRLY